ncbi:MAG: type IV toxin-antitoxin system AbiEi family antitoxin domain-containing protein [Actinomycetota bacterium]
MTRISAGISAENRRLLERLHRGAVGPFSMEQSAELLGVSLPRARRLVRYLADRGWLTRVRRGLYLPVPLDAHRSGETREDPWIAAHALLSPCYIGGWSAAEHWDLTEQIFNDLVVVTSRRPRERTFTVQGTTFVVHTVKQDRFFGLARVWRDSIRIQVSDPSRTMIDVLNDPGWGGGIRHVAEMLDEYVSGDHRSDELLVDYGDRLGNATVFKRLGFLLEALGHGSLTLIDTCLTRRSRGIGLLDPTIKAGGSTTTRWGLRVNASVSPVAS